MKFKSSFWRGRIGAAALLSLVSGAVAQSTQSWEIVNPVPVDPANKIQAVWGGDAVDPARPSFSPPPKDIASIPPMPMGQPRTRGLPRIDQPDDSVTLYDGETGEIRVIPKGQGMPPINGLSKAPSTGLPGPITSEDQTNWSDTMAAVSDGTLQTYPARANVKLAMRYIDSGGANRYFVCSGSMQDSGVVLTAGHCVYARDPNGIVIFDYAEEIWVIPSWDGTGNSSDLDNDDILQYYGWARTTQYIVGTAWVNNGDWDRDVAALSLNRTNTRSVGMLTGSFGWAYGNCSTSTTHYNYSYPAQSCSASLHTGRQMYRWADQPDGCPGIIHGNQFDLNTPGGCLNAVWGGMSGSGMYFISDGSRFVSAVCSTSNRDDDANYCALWEGFVTDMTAFQTGTRGSTFDIEALQYRAGSGTPTVQQGNNIPAGNVIIANATNNNPAPREITLHVYLSSNTDVSTSDTLIATWNYPSVDFGAMDSKVYNIPAMTVPFGTTTGTKYVGIIIDANEDTNDNNSDTDSWDAQRITVTSCSLPAAPTGFIATDALFCDRVGLTWTGVSGATNYKIYRNTVNNSGTATLLAIDAASPYEDFSASASGLGYYYWLRTNTGCGDSGFSSSAFGFRTTALVTAPTVAASNSTSCTQTTVTWNSISGADTYNIYRGTGPNALFSSLLSSGATSPYNDLFGLQGIGYYYFVRGINECGQGPSSAGNLGGRQFPAAIPTGVSASSDSCVSIAISWTSVVNADNYSIYRSLFNNSLTAVFLASDSASPYSDSTADIGTTYYYWIRASNACGLSSFSASNSGQRSGAPATPANVQAADNVACSNTIAVTWNPVPNVAGYYIYRNTVNNSATSTQIVGVSAAFTNWNDLAPNPGTTYFYWVRAANECDARSPYGVGDSGTRGSAPVAATNVLATDGTRCNAVTVTWTASAGATGYDIRRNTVNNSGTSTLLGNDTASPYIDNSVVGSTTYFYWVRATSSCGSAPLSIANTGFAGTGIVIDVQPQSVDAIEGTDAVFTIEVAGATGYLWRKNGIGLANGGNISGATTDTLTLTAVAASDAGFYSCLVSSPCGSVISRPAELVILGIPCPADYNQDGGIDGSDVQVFFDDWSLGLPQADVNFDGGVDGADVDAFFIAWSNGGC